jgi:hypothetical protein
MNPELDCAPPSNRPKKGAIARWTHQREQSSAPADARHAELPSYFSPRRIGIMTRGALSSLIGMRPILIF